MCEQTTKTDEVLCTDAQNGDREALTELVERYMRIVRSITRPYFLAGGDNEDLLQEGMLGLLAAIRDYEYGKSSFRTFAVICIRRKVIDAMKLASGKKHEFLNRSVSIEQLSDDDMNLSYPELIGFDGNPETMFIDRAEAERVRNEIGNLLSGIEKSVLTLYLKGLSYSEIGNVLGKSVKFVDNAIQRLRRKIYKYYYE